MKKLFLLSSCVGLIAAPVLSHAVQMSIFDGSSVFSAFGAVPTQDAVNGNPAPSATVTANAWGNTCFGLSTSTVAPATIDWSGAGGITFDYKTSTASNLYKVGLYLWDGAGNTNVAMVEYPTTSTLTADGQWHTFSADVSGWLQAYTDGVANSTWNTQSPAQWRIYFQAGATGFNAVSIDNVGVTAVPEPSTYAAFAGLLVLGLAFIRRRR